MTQLIRAFIALGSLLSLLGCTATNKQVAVSQIQGSDKPSKKNAFPLIIQSNVDPMIAGILRERIFASGDFDIKDWKSASPSGAVRASFSDKSKSQDSSSYVLDVSWPDGVQKVYTADCANKASGGGYLQPQTDNCLSRIVGDLARDVSIHTAGFAPDSSPLNHDPEYEAANRKAHTYPDPIPDSGRVVSDSEYEKAKQECGQLFKPRTREYGSCVLEIIK